MRTVETKATVAWPCMEDSRFLAVARNRLRDEASQNLMIALKTMGGKNVVEIEEFDQILSDQPGRWPNLVMTVTFKITPVVELIEKAIIVEGDQCATIRPRSIYASL